VRGGDYEANQVLVKNGMCFTYYVRSNVCLPVKDGTRSSFSKYRNPSSGILAESGQNVQPRNGKHAIVEVILKSNDFLREETQYVEACTSFYEFSGTKKLAGWVGYWTPTLPHSRLSASHHRMPPHECTFQFGAIHPVWRAVLNAKTGTSIKISSKSK
jgi:hypothetical protein